MESMLPKFQYPFYLFVITGVFLWAALVQGIAYPTDDLQNHLNAMLAAGGKIHYELPEKLGALPLLTNPASMYLAAWIGTLVDSELTGLLFLNMCMYVVAGLFVFNMALLLFGRESAAYIAAVFFLSNYFIFHYGGASYYTDMGGWALYTATLYFTVRFFYSKKPTHAYAAGLSAALGLFFKESGGMGVLSLALAIAMVDLPWVKKFSIACYSFSFFIFNIAYHLKVFLIDGYSYFDRYKSVGAAYGKEQSIWHATKAMGSLFFAGWPAVIVGIWATFWRPLVASSNLQKALLIIGVSAPAFLIYPVHEPRMAALSVPFLALLATAGLQRIGNHVIIGILLGIYIGSNFFMGHILAYVEPDSVVKFVSSFF